MDPMELIEHPEKQKTLQKIWEDQSVVEVCLRVSKFSKQQQDLLKKFMKDPELIKILQESQSKM